MIKLRQSALRSAFIGAVVLFWAAPALAQDNPSFNWTGFYLGGHAGGAWRAAQGYGYSDANFHGFDPHSFPGVGDSSAMGGIYGGFNWQISSLWVVGIEADVSFVSLGDSSFLVTPPGSQPSVIAPSSATMSMDTDRLASVRGRVGFAADNALFYVTGGVALAQVDYNGRLAFSPLPGLTEAATLSSKVTVPGWVVGAGFEWAMPSNWTIRAEYLYYALNTAKTLSADFLPKPCVTGDPVDKCDLPAKFAWSDANIQVLRVGLGYKF
jgi:outer membrane immunogenic protein